VHTAPAQAEPVEDVKRVMFHIDKGFEFSVTIAFPHKSLVPRVDWIQDKDAASCISCGAAFTTFNRRHHCRRCGRVFCGNCCERFYDNTSAEGGSDRLCFLCKEVLNSASDPNANPVLFDITKIINNEQLANFLMCGDFTLVSEYVRLMQNYLRNNECRHALLVTHAPFVYRVADLLNQAVRTTVSAAEKKTFISMGPKSRATMTAKEANALISHCLGFFLNLSASSNPAFTQFLVNYREIDIVSSVISCLDPAVDLVKQELAIWLLRNFTAEPSAIPRILDNPVFMKALPRLLSTGVRNLTEFVTTLIGNMLHNNQALAPKLVPTALTQVRAAAQPAPMAMPMQPGMPYGMQPGAPYGGMMPQVPPQSPGSPAPGTVLGTIQKGEIFKGVIAGINTPAHITQCMSMRCVGLYMKNLEAREYISTTDVFGSMVKALGDRAAEYNSASSGSRANNDMKYVRAATGQNAQREILESYVMSGGLLGLADYLEAAFSSTTDQNEAKAKAASRLVAKSVEQVISCRELMLYMVRCLVIEGMYACAGAARLISTLIKVGGWTAYEAFDSDPEVRRTILRNFVIVLEKPFIIREVTKYCDIALSDMKALDESVGKEAEEPAPETPEKQESPEKPAEAKEAEEAKGAEEPKEETKEAKELGDAAPEKAEASAEKPSEEEKKPEGEEKPEGAPEGKAEPEVEAKPEEASPAEPTSEKAEPKEPEPEEEPKEERKPKRTTPIGLAQEIDDAIHGITRPGQGLGGIDLSSALNSNYMGAEISVVERKDEQPQMPFYGGMPGQPYGAPQSAYGQPAGPYGAPAQAAPAGPYGAPAPASAGPYGAPAAPAASAQSGPYGAPQQPSAAGPYGVSAPAQPSGPYGAPAQTSAGPYGAPAQASAGPYGAPAAPAAPAASAPTAGPYGAPAVQENVGPYGAPAPASAPAPATQSAPSAGPYGAPAAQTNGPYGQPASAGPYGAPAQPSAAGPYGAPAPTATGPYGAPAPANAGPYGAPAQTGPYGAPASASAGPYGAPAPSAGPYGAPAAPNPYGAPQGGYNNELDE